MHIPYQFCWNVSRRHIINRKILAKALDSSSSSSNFKSECCSVLIRCGSNSITASKSKVRLTESLNWQNDLEVLQNLRWQVIEAN